MIKIKGLEDWVQTVGGKFYDQAWQDGFEQGIDATIAVMRAVLKDAKNIPEGRLFLKFIDDTEELMKEHVENTRLKEIK